MTAARSGAVAVFHGPATGWAIRVSQPSCGVDPDPDGGVALWLPGMNAPCRTSLTHLSKAEATAFARSVDDSGPLPSGIVNCPNDDESGLTVFLTYPGRAEAEVVRVGLSGCSYISAPGRTARSSVSWDPLRPFPSGLH